MKIDKKYFIRRNLDSYSELIFGKFLLKKGQEAYYPFKDKGIDLIGLDKKKNIYFYQLKARTYSLRKKVWGFKIDEEKLKEFPKTKNSYWVFCALSQDEKTFDFFIFPIKYLIKIYDERKKSCGKRESHFIDIRMNLKSKKWEFISPERLNRRFNLERYHIN